MKDPACLFYIGDWLTSTAEMDADCRGWYLNLLLHNYDKGTLPNEIEKLAVLCNVKFSEYKRFEHVFEQVLKQKFELLEDGRLSNQRTQSILKARELFKDKRSNAGKTSYLMRFFYNKYKKESKDSDIVDYIKSNLDSDIDTKNEHLIEQMFKHLLELYRNENEIENKTVIDYENLRVYWNIEFEKTKIPNIQTMTDSRKKAVSLVLKKYSKDQIKEAISKAKKSDFLSGKNNSDWKLSFDWFFKVPNFTKVIEGNYDNNKLDTNKSIFG
jgi:uncharacterized protein YdaU (DUF1376 family)